MANLTATNTNAEAHRLTGDTLIAHCWNCDHGEVVVTDMIEDGVGRCIECDAGYRLVMEEITE